MNLDLCPSHNRFTSSLIADSSLAGGYASLTAQFHVDYSSQGDGLEPGQKG
jgi:hypothetical protein